MRLAIITPRVPGREHFWPQVVASIGEVPDSKHFFNDPANPILTGSGGAMNRLLREAEAEGFTHYTQLSDDDFFLPGWYEAWSAPFRVDPDLDMVYSDIATCSFAGQVGGTWSPPAFSNERLLWEPTLPGAGIISLRVWQRAGGYPEDDTWASDWLMLAKASPLHVFRVAGAHYCHRQHAQRETEQGDRAGFAARLAKIREEKNT